MTEITRERLTDMFLEDRAAALELRQTSAAAEAVSALVSLHGLDKEDESKMNQMTTEELRIYIAEAERSKASQN